MSKGRVYVVSDRPYGGYEPVAWIVCSFQELTFFGPTFIWRRRALLWESWAFRLRLWWTRPREQKRRIR